VPAASASSLTPLKPPWVLRALYHVKRQRHTIEHASVAFIVHIRRHGSIEHRMRRGEAMNGTGEQSLISRIRTLSPQQVAEVEDFVDFLAAKSKKRAAIDRLLAIAPALEAAGVEPMSEDEIAAEVKAARAERRVADVAKGAG
jgi:hypothetical protein